MAKIKFVEMQGLFSYSSGTTRINFGEKNLIVGPNDSGKSSIFKALDFFLNELTSFYPQDKKPWTSQTYHEMTVGLALDTSEREYLLETLSVTDTNRSNVMCQLSPQNLVKYLADQFKDVEITIKWQNPSFQPNDIYTECLLRVEDLGITIYSRGYNEQTWITDAKKPKYGSTTNSKSFAEAVGHIVKRKNFEKDKFSCAFAAKQVLVIQFPDPTKFTNARVSRMLDSASADRIDQIMNMSGNRPVSDLRCSFFIMFGYLLERRLSFISERRNFLESNDLEQMPLKDDGSNLQSCLFWLRNSDRKDEQVRYSTIKRTFEEIMGSQHLSFDLSIITKGVTPSDVIMTDSEVKKYPDRAAIMFTKTATSADQESIGFTDVGAGVRETLFLLVKCFGSRHDMILMDEPATNLHPVQIRRLMNKIFAFSGSGRESNQVMIVTHSPVLATLELLSSVNEIIRISRAGKHSSTAQPSGDDKEWLDRNIATFHLLKPDVLFARGVVLVEGPSDRILLEAILNRGKDFGIQENDLVVLDVCGFKSFKKFQKFLKIFDIPFVILGDKQIRENMPAEETRVLTPKSVFREDEFEGSKTTYVLEDDLEYYLASLNPPIWQEVVAEYNTKPEIAYHFTKLLLEGKVPDGMRPIIVMIGHLNWLVAATGVR